jgi:hypothetical protein
LTNYFEKHPEVFPEGFAPNFHFHDQRESKKIKGLIIRRIKLKNGRVYEVVPSNVMPYLSGKTEEVSKGLLLRHWAVPYDVIALLFGKDAMYWERLEESLGRMSIVGSLVKKSEVPVHVASDEKISFHNGKEVYIGLTSSRDCILGAELSLSEDTAGLQEAYEVFKTEALDCKQDYCPVSVNLDGWKATNQAWRNLFPTITIVLCFLHAFLKIRDVGKSLKEKFHEIGDQIWTVYREKTKEDFQKKIKELALWAELNIVDNERVKAKIQNLCNKESRFIVAYDHPQCYRTSNQIDRPMNILDRYLYQMRYFRGSRKTANSKIRGWAMIYNFMPFSQRTQKQKDKPKKSCRFEELNGFVYHSNWLENMLIASSMNGFKQSHKKR